MEKKLNEEKFRMKKLAGILLESDSQEVQVWYDLDGVLADFEGSLKYNEELQSFRSDFDKLVDDEFPEYKNLDNDEIKSKFKKDLEENSENEDIKRLKKVFNKYNK